MTTYHDQRESETFTIRRIGWDSLGIVYVCWSGGSCFTWSAWL